MLVCEENPGRTANAYVLHAQVEHLPPLRIRPGNMMTTSTDCLYSPRGVLHKLGKRGEKARLAPTRSETRRNMVVARSVQQPTAWYNGVVEEGHKGSRRAIRGSHALWECPEQAD